MKAWPKARTRRRQVVLLAGARLVPWVLLTTLMSCRKAPQSGDTSCLTPATKRLKRILAAAPSFERIFAPSDTVRLETDPEALIGTINQVCRHPVGYLILDRMITRQVYLFDHQGRFVRKLGSRGRGPREYRQPRSVWVDQEGISYVLDSSLRKILVYDPEGEFQREIGLRGLGIFPSALAIAEPPAGGKVFLFYNIHPDFRGKRGRGSKVVVAAERNGALVYLRSFGKPEPLLRRLFYDLGTFDLAPDGSVWLGDIFDLGIQIYGLDGRPKARISAHARLLPRPYVTPSALSGFTRISQSLDTYYRLTRLSDLVFLDGVVIGIFYSKDHIHFVFFDPCGRVLPWAITAEKHVLPSAVVGTWGGKFYVMVEPEATVGEAAPVANPMLVGFEPR